MAEWTRLIGMVFVGCLTAGCVHYLPAAVSTNPIGSKYEKPVKVVTGVSRAYYIGGIGPIGNDSLEAALDDALGYARADTMANVFVDRRLICFPLCNLPLIFRVDTIITGTLVDYVEMERTEPIAKEPVSPATKPLPPTRPTTDDDYKKLKKSEEPDFRLRP